MIVYLEDTAIAISSGSTAIDLIAKQHQLPAETVLAVSINGVLSDLHTPLSAGDRLALWDFGSRHGKEVFWHTSAHVLAQAVLRLYPQAKPTIGPAIANGFYYDFADLAISVDDLQKIEAQACAILAEGHHIQRHLFASKQEAAQQFADNPYKLELIESSTAPLTAYSQGEYFDLCRGPHLLSVEKIKAFKLLTLSGAYWRGDPQRKMLQRIYGISFPDHHQLHDYLQRRAAARQRDHRILGQHLALFSIVEQAPGGVLLHPCGMHLWNRLLGLWQEMHRQHGYVEIKTPTLLSQELWQRSGHWQYYRDNMYVLPVEKRHFALKPMNCPGCMLYYLSETRSYRQLPLRVAELGHVHRQEPSGALSGLLRLRSFHQDDAHLFVTAEQIEAEILAALRLADRLYSTFGLGYHLELSTRPANSLGADEEWEMATRSLQSALQDYHQEYTIRSGDGAFYGPKIDLHIEDALGRSWQCGTLQLDMVLGKKFGLEYSDHEMRLKTPIIIHRAIFGSMERFLAILIEHFAGKFPLWISPRPVAILTVADRHVGYAQRVAKAIEAIDLPCTIDASDASVSKKVRRAQLLQVNYIVLVGDRELEQQTVSLRRRDHSQQHCYALPCLIDHLQRELQTRSLHPLAAVNGNSS